MAHRGQLGHGVEQGRHMNTAKCCRLVLAAESDCQSGNCVEKIDAALGSIDRDLLRAVIMENQSPAGRFKAHE